MTNRFPPKQMLVPVDVDPMADRALANRLVEDASALARALDARITVVHIASPSIEPLVATAEPAGYRAMCDVLAARNAHCGRILKEIEAQVRESGIPVAVQLVTANGSAPDLILEAARDCDADMIVMTTHGRRGLARLFLGSVAERTAHLSHVPVLLLPPR